MADVIYVDGAIWPDEAGGFQTDATPTMAPSNGETGATEGADVITDPVYSTMTDSLSSSIRDSSSPRTGPVSSAVTESMASPTHQSVTSEIKETVSSAFKEVSNAAHEFISSSLDTVADAITNASSYPTPSLNTTHVVSNNTTLEHDSMRKSSVTMTEILDGAKGKYNFSRGASSENLVYK